MFRGDYIVEKQTPARSAVVLPANIPNSKSYCLEFAAANHEQKPIHAIDLSNKQLLGLFNLAYLLSFI
jgi:hypothetical protein